MVGNGGEVDGAVDACSQCLFAKWIGQGDGLAFGVTVGAVRVIFLVRQEGIEGVSGVNMQVAKKRLAQGLVVAAGLCAVSGYGNRG